MRTSIQLEYAKSKIKPKNSLTANLDFNQKVETDKHGTKQYKSFT